MPEETFVEKGALTIMGFGEEGALGYIALAYSCTKYGIENMW